LNSLVNFFVQMMGDVFPELKDNEKKIQDMIRDEEQSFENTLAKGYEKFKKAADAVKENGGTVLSGQASVLSFLIPAHYLIPFLWKILLQLLFSVFSGL